MNLKEGLFLFTLCLSQAGFAATTKACHLEGKIVLNETTDLICPDDVMDVAEGTEIDTKGYALNLRAKDGHIEFPKSCLKINYDGRGANRFGADILITADTLKGCVAFDAAQSHITLDATTYKGFNFTVATTETCAGGPSDNCKLQVLANGDEINSEQLKRLER